MRRILVHAAGLLGTHLELFGLELQDALQRLVADFILGVIAVVLGCLSLALATVLLLIIFWESHRIAVAVVLMLVYGGGAVAFACYVRHRLRHAPDLFSATCAELARDRKALLQPAAEEEA
ncbi:phage holin family protein [Iodobacter ciconiae]|uniref:phage holin family protein n=1 Tax=Iodobacter ciconiae TaxID=2496266 RepID=UPI0013DEB076|nr:phage holin family protein [Iodobacter ciconiae]